MYLDIATDVEVQLCHVAFTILDTMAKELNLLKVIEILEEKELRTRYIQKLKKALKISESKIDKLYKQVKDSIMIE